ncbi:unnamed protein product [Rodentolepis nana]|uniref:Uncharacterized protein n=1 Tax=Rodentolepis nana TaxID=102285 RepID=A0A0R3TTK7_RODNA|nr:unnamed protein product [Rodentolepis nana]
MNFLLALFLLNAVLIDNCLSAIIDRNSDYLSGLQMIIGGLNKNDRDFSEIIDKIPDLNEVFKRLNGTTLSKVLAKVKNPDSLFYLLQNQVLLTVMQNIPPETYKRIEPRLNTTKLRLQAMWKYREPHDPGPVPRSAQELILLKMPNIPFAHVDALDGINASALHYIITNHYALPTLLVLMQPKTLEYVFKHAPYVINYIVRMSSQEQFDIMSRLPDACGYLRSAHSDQSERIVNNLTSFGMCTSESATKPPNSIIDNKFTMQ